MVYDRYKYLKVTVADGIAVVEASHPLYDWDGHAELSRIWRDLQHDREVRSIVFTWLEPPGSEPPTHIDPEFFPWTQSPDQEERAARIARWVEVMTEGREALQGVMDCSKMVVSAIRGEPSYGQALTCALLADLSVASETVTIEDRHIDGAVVPGDGLMYWALLCGVQKAKLLALTGDGISGREAERIGLVSLAVPEDDVLPTAIRYAQRFAAGPQHAQHFTKRSLNQLLRLASITSYESAWHAELVSFFGDPDVEAVRTAKSGYRGQGQPRDPNATAPHYPSTHPPRDGSGSGNSLDNRRRPEADGQ